MHGSVPPDTLLCNCSSCIGPPFDTKVSTVEQDANVCLIANLRFIHLSTLSTEPLRDHAGTVPTLIARAVNPLNRGPPTTLFSHRSLKSLSSISRKPLTVQVIGGTEFLLGKP